MANALKEQMPRKVNDSLIIRIILSDACFAFLDIKVTQKTIGDKIGNFRQQSHDEKELIPYSPYSFSKEGVQGATLRRILSINLHDALLFKLDSNLRLK
ncbi:hypothetical protein NPIL_367491 [Nephila pilipes]|uniref:Uncharacterized protein n=1 Tax=Nephila pilipes TaxID=299642 RepID=A0A8X6Q0N7_NEPPI|nr:hypothetical protein NPIL_367491 [Nephila pilipes]